MKVKELLSDASKWTNGTFARNANDVPTWEHGKDACKWCLLGAIAFCYPNSTYHFRILNKVRDIISRDYNGLINIGIFNDDSNRTFEQIRSILEEADV
jgi:hypothetical protein